MNDILKTVLSLSLSGSVIAIILFAVKPFLKDRISKTWQYYIWLVVIIRLLIPFTSEINILNELFNSTEINTIIPIDNASPNYQINNVSPNYRIANDNHLNEMEISQNVIENDIVSDNINSTKFFEGYLSAIQGNGWFVWLLISVILLLKKIISYHVYVHYIKSNRKLITDESIITTFDEVCDKSGMTRKIGLYSYKKINSPMLIGFVKSYILLPETMIKTTDGLQYILLHELTHYRRLDFLYKWLVQIVVCVHFFNPIVYFVRKSINSACEFSCDEMVIKKLDEQSKKAYGTALIDALELSTGYNQPAISFMLCEDIKIIKERLGAIMKYKNGNKFMLVITMFLTLAISFGAIFTGAYAASNTDNNKPNLTNEIGISSKEQEITNQVDKVAHPQIEDNKTNVSSKEQARLEYAKQNVLVRSTDLLTYDDTEHYYIKTIVDNNSNDNVISYKLSLLAFDEKGNPKKVAWWSEPLYDSNGWVEPVAVNGKYTNYNNIREYELILPYNMDIISLDFGEIFIDSSYRRNGVIYDEHGNALDYKHFDFHEPFYAERILKPGQSDNPVNGGWSIFDGWGEGGHGISYIIGCITEIQYEGKDKWMNPYYEYWLEDYKGKTVSIELLRDYYVTKSGESNNKYISHSDSLKQNFEKYKLYGVTYDAEQNTVYYSQESGGT